ncbi:uncharacterized protein LOC143258703 isoform X3 [Tachypleus tridentatus]|uniref:uncharacterized protein LOC143258703 isoform X3 n=1 Tax=Tachypleus tridentatus TaxID=6853 RepID=UPI003FD31417
MRGKSWMNTLDPIHQNRFGGCFPCPLCKKVFTFSTNMKRHCRTQHGGAPFYYCNICQKPFNRSGSYKSHLQAVHGILERRGRLVQL